jgi:hypothetical protein
MPAREPGCSAVEAWDLGRLLSRCPAHARSERMKSLVIGLALFASVEAAAQRSPAASEHFTWQGAVTGAPLTPDSPLSPIPQVEGARRLTLPALKGPIPKGVAIPFAEGGGPITLLGPWRGGRVVGTDAGEWGGALYLVMPDKRVTIARGNVIGDFSWRGRLYILSGVRHLMLDKGEL